LAHENDDCRTIYGSALEYEGCAVRLSADGDDALRALANGAFDLLVSDLYVPSDEDQCLLRRVRQHAKLEHLPVIILTGWTTEAHRRVAIDAGADVFLTLPVTPSQLLETVHELLGRQAESPPTQRAHAATDEEERELRPEL